MQTIDNLFLGTHITAGTLSLVLFWIPVFARKGGKLHLAAGRWYYRCMWLVLLSAAVLSVFNYIDGDYVSAAFLGFLTVLTGYPLWYSREILRQSDEWSDRYFRTRKLFCWALFLASVGMVVGAIWLRFNFAGTLMAFFGLLGLPAWRDIRMSKAVAMQKEKRLERHISGTIISGIAAYTAFLAFGGRALFADILTGYWQVVPWFLPTVIGVIAARITKRRYRTQPSRAVKQKTEVAPAGA